MDIAGDRGDDCGFKSKTTKNPSGKLSFTPNKNIPFHIDPKPFTGLFHMWKVRFHPSTCYAPAGSRRRGNPVCAGHFHFQGAPSMTARSIRRAVERKQKKLAQSGASEFPRNASRPRHGIRRLPILNRHPPPRKRSRRAGKLQADRIQRIQKEAPPANGFEFSTSPSAPRAHRFCHPTTHFQCRDRPNSRSPGRVTRMSRLQN